MIKKKNSKNFLDWQKRGQIANKGSKRSFETILKLRTSLPRGEKHWNWKGGISDIRVKIRKNWMYINWRNKIFKRDLYTCQICKDKTGGNLEAHHIRPLSTMLKEVKMVLLDDDDWYTEAMSYEPMFNIDNGITYCKKCHFNIHNP